MFGLIARRTSSVLPQARLLPQLRLLSTPVPSSEAPKVDANPLSHRTGTHKVDNFERKMLVWTGRYKTADEIPAYINQEVMERTRNKIRIRLANIMMALTAVGCVIMVMSGKKAAERGETVQKQNLDWHKEYNEQAQVEASKKK